MEANDNLRSADEELKESHVELLSRFYKLFESVHRYYIELNSFLQDLDDGRFIQTSLESVFQDMDGKQLLVSDNINQRTLDHLEWNLLGDFSEFKTNEDSKEA